MLHRIFLFTLSLNFILHFCQDAAGGVLLSFKPRLRESMYTWYSKGETLFVNGSYEKYVTSNTQAYVGQRTVQTLENGYLVQKVGIHGGNIAVNDQVYAHPSVGQTMEYVLAPWGGIPKAMGTGTQFQVKNLQLVFPNQPVSIGTSWSVTIPPSITFPLPTRVDYEVSNILGGLVVIQARTSVEKAKAGSSLEFSMKGTSQIIFNADEGILVRNESHQFVEVSFPGKIKRSTQMNVNTIMELQF